MSLYTLGEICKRCKHAIFYECGNCLKKCKIDKVCDTDTTRGKCEHKEE